MQLKPSLARLHMAASKPLTPHRPLLLPFDVCSRYHS